ncbi:MAG: DUF1850 domain-containing protein [Selenomonadaceae bacterium]|nr:DUF1850 domain-containing protein [Selenomonadaceae bacterium]
MPMMLIGCNVFGKTLIVKAIVDEREEMIEEMPAKAGISLKIKFIHSVQKTPVEEDLEFDGAVWIVHRTRYKSQGVGLPFMESDGDFRREGDWFVMDGMERRIERLSLRTGLGTQLTLELDGKEIKLYEMFEPGTRIDLVVE